MSKNFKITTSTELMYNYKQFELFDQQDAFKAVQTADGHSMFFGQSTDKTLFLVLEQSGVSTGWKKIALTQGLAGKVKTFTVAQSHSSGNIQIAVAMQDPTGVDKLYLCMDMSNTDLAWTEKSINWNYIADDRVGSGNPKLIIDDIHLSESSSGHKYVIVDITGKNGFVDRYWINTQMLPAWNKHPLSFNISADISDKSLMGRKEGEPVDGIYTFGAEYNVPQFVYTPLYNIFAPSSAPNPTNFDLTATGITDSNGSFTTCKALSGADNATDIFLAGNGALYYLASENQSQLAKPKQLLKNNMLTAIRDLQASVHNNQVVVWGLNDADQVFYLSCDKNQINNASSWSTPLPLMTKVSEISQYMDVVNGGLTLFGLSGDGVLLRGIQDPENSNWSFGQIELPATNSKTTASKEKSFTTSIKVTDKNNNPSGNTAVKLSPNGRTGVYINHVYYALNGEPITVKTDPSGMISVVEWISGLVGTSFDISINDDKATVKPSNIPVSKMKNLGTVSALEEATITNHDGSTRSLIPSSLSSDDKKALASAISDLNMVHASLTKSVIPTTRPSARRSVVAEVASPIKYIEVLWGDLVESLKHFGEYIIEIVKDTASDVWHFIVKIGNEIYGFIINTVEKIAGALKSIWNKIVKGFEDLWEFLKFLFEWQDMLLTRDVFKQTVKIFMHRIGEDIQKVKNDMDHAIVNAEGLIKEWADPDAKVPPLGEDNSNINETLKDKQANPEIHSAPSELLKSHFTANAHRSTVTESKSTATPDPTWSGLTDLSGFVKSEKETITDLKNQLMALFVSGSNAQENPDIETILKKIFADVAIGALDLFKMAADKVLDFLTLLIYEAIELLDAPMYIPVLSDILKDMFDIELPSILDVICLIGAVPTTIVYKAVKGRAPYESGDGTIHDKITKAKTYKELQANFNQTGDKITLSKDAQAVIFETFYLLSGISTIINGILVVLDEEVDGAASTVLSTPKTITSLLSSATVGIASLFHFPIGIKNDVMKTFSGILSKISIAMSLGFAVAPKVIAKVKGISEDGPLNELKIQINLVKTGISSVLSVIGLVPQTYHIIEIIVDGDATKPNGSLGILDSIQGITKRLGTVAGFVALIDEDEETKQLFVLVQGLLVGVTGGIQIEMAGLEATISK